MYSVFLVEDEIVIREGIKQLVPWETHGFTFVGEAPDGELAWPAIQKLNPDIVITDIKMPFMDGLELSRLIRKELPKTIIIILSGHDDFSYAKEAIEIGVSQYLLKPLSRSELEKVLQEIKDRKEREENDERYNRQFLSEVQEYLMASHRDFFDVLVSGTAEISKLMARAQKLGLRLISESYNIVLFMITADGYSSDIAEAQSKITESFHDMDHCITFTAGMDVTAFLIKGDADDIEAQTADCTKKLREICKALRGGGGTWTVAAGHPVDRLSSVSACYRTARKELFNKAGKDFEIGEPKTNASRQQKNLLENAVKYMKENYTNPDISLNEVAKVANVIPTYFSAVFSHRMGKTFVEYLTELRMEKAREMLRHTNENSGEIALKVGYNDPHYFSFLFKKINGCSPRSYRNAEE